MLKGDPKQFGDFFHRQDPKKVREALNFLEKIKNITLEEIYVAQMLNEDHDMRKVLTEVSEYIILKSKNIKKRV